MASRTTPPTTDPNAALLAATLKQQGSAQIQQPGGSSYTIGTPQTPIAPPTNSTTPAVTPPAPAPTPVPSTPVLPSVTPSNSTPAPTSKPIPANAVASPGGGYTIASSDGRTFQYDANGNQIGVINTPTTTPSDTANAAINNSIATPPLSEDDLIAKRRSEAQAQIDAVTQQFNSIIAQDTATGQEREQETNALNVARGLVGAPDASAAMASTQAANKKVVDADRTQLAATVAGILSQVDQNAIAEAAQAKKDYTANAEEVLANQQKIAQQAQDSINQLAKSGVSLDQLKQTPQYQKLVSQSGYDPNMFDFVYNAAKSAANQIDYTKIPAQTNPDGTITFFGSDPSKGGAITSTTLDTAPQGYKTVMVGNMPYWQVLGADGKPDPNGAMFPVPSTKSNFITLKDAAGTTYLYDTYSGRTINPGGADTTSAGTPGNNTPATPLTQSSTLGQLLGYYTGGDTSKAVGSGYSGAVVGALGGGVSLDTPISQITPEMIPALAQGIMQAEGGSKSAAAVVNNPAAILWTTAKAYSLDQQFGATPYKAPNGYTYASFPDQQSGTNALQSYLGSLIGSGKPAQPSAQAQNYANDIINGTITNISSVPKQYKDQVAAILDNKDKTAYPPLTASRYTMAANRIVANYISQPAYQLTAGGELYLGRIKAAMQTPGSVSDQDLLDSLTKLNTGGNAISDAQVKLITDGKSFADMASTMRNKLANGGVLSDNQRQQIQTLAQNIFKSYQDAYQPIYDQATQQLQAAGIPKAFWTIPDLNTLSATQSGQSIQDMAAAKGYDYNAMKTDGFTDEQIRQVLNAQ